MPLIIQAVSWLLQLYVIMLILYCVGSMVPGARSQGWYRWVSEFVHPYLSLFRGLNLRVGMLDLTPTVAIIVLQILISITNSSLR